MAGSVETTDVDGQRDGQLDGQQRELVLTLRERPDDVAEVLNGLSTLLVDEEPTAQVLERVVQLATRTIPGCDAAGVTVVAGERPATAAHTDERTLAVDQAQYDVGDGPCLDAYRHRRINRVDLAEADDRWPAFVKAAQDEGIRSFLAAPLLVGEQALGALNLYSRSGNGFDALDEAFIGLLSAQAAAAVANATRYADVRQLAAQLEKALTSRAHIEQAKGVLMARHHVDEGTAFDLLRRESQHRNVKLRDVAEEVLATTRTEAR
ncbi:MAG TPA: GAF and ANTAR domain-containing protein [Motilibacteraceae bacterium]|nr:GAF and ANTAR domain-containing protein [Motilibacteraceae bacterium]